MADNEELLKYLANHLQQRKVIELRRELLGGEHLEAVVVDTPENYVVLNLLSKTGDFDGFSIVREADVTGFFWGQNAHKNIDVQLARKPDVEIDYSNWTAILQSLQDTKLAIAIHKEEIRQDSYYLTRNFEIMGDILVFEYIDLDGFIGGAGAMNIESISQIDFAVKHLDYLAKLTQIG